MIRLNNIKISLNGGDDRLTDTVLKQLKLSPSSVSSIDIIKKSVDARNKEHVHFVYSVDVAVKVDERRALLESGNKDAIIVFNEQYQPISVRWDKTSPIVVGAGPAGLFAALILAEAGAKPILIERGEDVDARVQAVNRFWNTGELDFESNVQFGEGGAGAFSDGKLTTGTKDYRQGKVLDTFISCGAPAEIRYLQKPHIGTDRLVSTVKEIRQKINRLGGRVLFRHRLTDLMISGGKITGIQCIDHHGNQTTFKSTQVILAVGHSARDVFSMLSERDIQLTRKPFSVGVRIEHHQSMVDQSQYGRFAGHPALPAADYKLAAHLPNGRSVYTFCMCPGGSVVASASEGGGVVTNGMSLYARDGKNANSALLVNITPEDFTGSDPFAGIEFQRKLEHAAFSAGGGNYKAPAQLTGDFLAGIKSKNLGSIMPTYRPGVTLYDLNELLPEYVSESLRRGIRAFDRRLKGFANPESVLTGLETRSSSPVRIPRNNLMQANIAGLFPCGEGAGYAGGILSAAVDGIRVAEAVLQAKA